VFCFHTLSLYSFDALTAVILFSLRNKVEQFKHFTAAVELVCHFCGHLNGIVADRMCNAVHIGHNIDLCVYCVQC